MADDIRFLEMAYSMPPDQLKLLKRYAAAPDISQAINMCRLYYPGFSGVDAEKFMTWLKSQSHL